MLKDSAGRPRLGRMKHLCLNFLKKLLRQRLKTRLFGMLHKDKEKHPTLASDLMEEWRAVLIDATVLSMLNVHELTKDEFYTGIEQPGVFLTKDGFKKYIQKLEVKFRTQNKYLSYVDYSVSFRRALDLQMNQFVKALETGDVNEYKPIIIR